MACCTAPDAAAGGSDALHRCKGAHGTCMALLADQKGQTSDAPHPAMADDHRIPCGPSGLQVLFLLSVCLLPQRSGGFPQRCNCCQEVPCCIIYLAGTGNLIATGWCIGHGHWDMHDVPGNRNPRKTADRCIDHRGRDSAQDQEAVECPCHTWSTLCETTGVTEVLSPLKPAAGTCFRGCRCQDAIGGLL